MKKTVAVIGSNGAIGNSISEILIKDDSVQVVYKFSRILNNENSDKVKNIQIDIKDETSIEKSIGKLPNDIKFDLIFVATGMLHNDDDIFPEKSIKDISKKKLQKILLVNTVGPTLVGKYFIPFLKKDTRSVFAFLSARVGSISDNKLGGWYSYRASKTALNQIIKNFSIEIRSYLSKPFEKNVKAENLFTPHYSAEKLLEVINNLDKDDSGKIYAWDGEEIQP